MVVGAFRGWVRIVSGPRRSRASQLIRGVRQTENEASWWEREAAGGSDPMGLQHSADGCSPNGQDR